VSLRAGRLWPAALAAVLAVTVVANLALLHVASDPDALAIEPDAYAKAVAWDSASAGAAASHALGWTAQARLDPAAAGGARVTVRIRDRAGRPVEGARVEVEAIRNGLARRFRGALPPRPERDGADDDRGTYAADLPLPRPGAWELRLRAERGTARFVTSLRVDLAPGAPGTP
jgi:nitrogen fixation protein FixH